MFTSLQCAFSELYTKKCACRVSNKFILLKFKLILWRILISNRTKSEALTSLTVVLFLCDVIAGAPSVISAARYPAAGSPGAWRCDAAEGRRYCWDEPPSPDGSCTRRKNKMPFGYYYHSSAANKSLAVYFRWTISEILCKVIKADKLLASCSNSSWARTHAALWPCGILWLIGLVTTRHCTLMQ